MKIFAIGDLHLSLNEKVHKPMDVFGPEWKDHPQRLEENWKKQVTAQDLVLLAGDISWALKPEEAREDLDWIESLPGKKVMIKGNHDLWWGSITKLNDRYHTIFFLQNTCYETQDYVICGSRGWICPGEEDFSKDDEKIFRREILRFKASLEQGKKARGKELIAMIHYPPTNDKKQGSDFTRLFEEFGVKTVVFGHLHGREAYKKGLQGNRNGVNYHLVSYDYRKGDLFLVKG